jgi:uncharacterized membrane protein YhhN
MGSSSHGAAATARRRPWFLLGFLLFLLGPVAYFVQFRLGRLTTPWYLPAVGTAGVLLMAAGAWQRRGVLRAVGLGVFVLLCGFEWWCLLVEWRTPPYTGPARPGVRVPAFAAALADGRPFTDRDLEGGPPSVLVFFRGRW